MNRDTYIAAGIAALVACVVGILLFAGSDPAGGRKAESAAVALASEGAPSFGAPGAPVHIVEFMDPACETCASFFPYVKRIMANNPGRIRLSVRHVAFHGGAEEAVRALEAARAQDRYWEALGALLENQDRWVRNHRVQPGAVWPILAQAGIDVARARRELDTPEVVARMERDLADAIELGVTKTPEYFVNGRQMPAFGYEELRALVDEELRRTARLAAAR
jgi:protein-disulfide isomerase